MIDIIKHLESAKTLNEKILILLDLWDQKQFWFFHGTKIGLDRAFDFNLHSGPLIDENDPFEGTFSFMDFQILIQNIKMDPKLAVELMNKAAEECSALMWNSFYRKILLKRVSWISRKDFNTILNKILVNDTRAKEFIVDVWQPQQSINGQRKGLNGLYMVEPKLNGLRLVIQVHMDGQIQSLTEDGFIHPFKPDLSMEWPISFALDGILVDETFWAFDLIPLAMFDANSCDLTLLERNDILVQMIGLFQQYAPNIRILEKIEMDIQDTGKFNEAKNYFKSQGFKSAIAKPLTSSYNRETTDWVQLKL